MKRAFDDAETPCKRQHVDSDNDRSSKPLRCPRPLGNLLLSTARNARNPGLGNLAILPDEILAAIFSELDAMDALRCQGTSRAFFAFATIEAHFKLAYIKRARGILSTWRGSWRSTYIHDFVKPPSANQLDALPSDTISIENVFSDVLYLPYLAAGYDSNTVASASAFTNNILRRDGREMVAAELGETPMILTGLMYDWAAMSASSGRRWSLASIAERYPETRFRAEAVLATMQDYLQYHNNCPADESPLYIFDADFVEKTCNKDDGAGLGADFVVPSIFADDLFKVLGTERPDYRWLIAGPARSGSTFHCDPNGTSAWNAVVTGRKLWILFPPDIIPPGIIVSDDQSEVEAPLSLAEWMLNYYAQAKALYGPKAKDPQHRGKMLEGICEEGEIFYVPSGWWHLVVNLEASIAVTQNFVSPSNLSGVLSFLKHRPDQVSGFKLRSAGQENKGSQLNDGRQEYCGEDDDETGGGAVYSRFVDALTRHDPELCMEAMKRLAQLESEQTHRKLNSKDASRSKADGSLWHTMVSKDKSEVGEEQSSGFTFGFALDVEEGDVL